MQTAADRTTPLPRQLVHDAAELLRAPDRQARLAAMQLLARGYADHEEERRARLGLDAGDPLLH